MKPVDVVMILVGFAGLGLGAYAVVKASRPSLAEGPIAAAQPAPAATTTLQKPQPPTPQDVAGDVKKTVTDVLSFIDGLGSTVDSLGKFFDRF